jgi:transcriptional regulator with XRE-family HTH domain
MKTERKRDLSRRIGGRLRLLREEMGFSLKTLAESTGLSPSFLSRVELGQTLPSLLTLHTIADALHVEIESIFSKWKEQHFVISKKNGRRRVLSVRGVDEKPCYEMELLADEMASPLMEPALVKILLRNRDELELTRHGGQEFCYVVHGHVEIVLDTHSFLLKPGDAVYWDGNIPHGAVTRGQGPAWTLNVHLVPGKRTGNFQTQQRGNGINIINGQTSEGSGKRAR